MKIQFIGCGNMGEILLKSLYDLGYKDINICLNSLDKAQYLKNKYHINIGKSDDADIVILCVKPQQLSDVDFSIYKKSGLLISILAGTSLKKLHIISRFDRIIRCMPNILLQVGRGVTGYVSLGSIEQKESDFIYSLFATLGICLQLNNEDSIDALTALTGSGPAYFYYILECFEYICIKFGFSQQDANMFAKQTFCGSALMLENSGLSGQELRQKITSKGGTTQRAVEIFEKLKLHSIICTGINGAYHRAKELNK